MSNYLTLRNAGWLVTALVSFMLIFSGFNKVIGSEEMVRNFTSINLLPYLALVGIAELLSVGLLIYSRTTLYGSILITSIMSAAAVIHLSYMGGSGILMPIMIGVFSWVAYYLRNK